MRGGPRFRAMASDLEKLETSLLGDIASPRPVTFLG